MLNFSLLPSSAVFLPSSLPASFVNSTGTVKLGNVPLTVSPSPSPEPTGEPTPQPTVTVTTTAAPTGPQDVVLDGEQFAGITVGLVLAVMLLAAILISQMRRP